MHWIVTPDVIYHMIAGGVGGIFISEVKLPVLVKYTAFCFVNELIGRIWVSTGVISLLYN
jgi:hypothetical protein